MARTYSYTKRDLTVACSKLKTFIIKKIKSGDLEIKSITKSYVCNDLARRLKLSSGSSLWKSNYQYKDYLDEWYSGLIDTINSCKPDTTKQSECTTNTVDTPPTKTTGDDLNTIKELKDTINTLNSIILNLRIENESLRMARIHRIRRLDTSSDILDESINDVELHKLYQAVSTLYKSRFPDKEKNHL